VDVTLVNGGDTRLTDLELRLEPPPEWSFDGDLSIDALGPGESATARFRLSPTLKAVLDSNQRLGAAYRALEGERSVRGENFTWIQAGAPVEVRFSPLFDVADYRKFARETRTDWVMRLSSRVRRHRAHERRQVEAANASSPKRADWSRASGNLLDAAAEVGPSKEPCEASLRLRVDERVLPPSRHSAKVVMKMRAGAFGLVSEDISEVYALPTLAIPRVAVAPRIDGDLSDLQSFARGEISHEDLWWRRKPEGPADSSAVFYLAYDSANLYAGIEVRDDVVVCNIAPDDIKAQLRSDAVGITVDPSGASRDTSTVLQAAAFPCTTEGFAARGFRDADANQGLMEETAPGMEVASRKLEYGYTLEAKIPWAVMPHQPRAGDEIGLNIVVYDGDAKDARVGANVSESGIAWAAFEWGGKQALPYLWPRVVLAR
jgi:hypothetical protein